MKKSSFIVVGTLILAIVIHGCGKEENYVPKPKGYLRLEMEDDKTYQKLDSDCPYSFEYPDYAQVVSKTSGAQDECFKNVEFPKYKATIHLTYKEVDSTNLNQLLTQSHNLLVKHQIKANSIEDTFLIDRDNHKFALVHNLIGNAASNCQFIVTDSTDHFLRGSLHFMAPPNYDSLRPVINYLTKDIYHLIETLEWE